MQLVNKIAREDVAPVETGYEAGTRNIAVYFKDMQVEGTDQRLALVDTPGLLGDDGYNGQAKVALDISEFLANLYVLEQL